MTVPLALFAGAVFASGLVRVARTGGAWRAHRIYAIGLVVAALIYLGFAVAGQASVRWLALEVLGVALYGAAAWIGLQRWLVVLALGWGAHVAWDVLLHLDGPGASYTPDWYPWLCVSFDLVLAGAVLVRGHYHQVARSQPAV